MKIEHWSIKNLKNTNADKKYGHQKEFLYKPKAVNINTLLNRVKLNKKSEKKRNRVLLSLASIPVIIAGIIIIL